MKKLTTLFLILSFIITFFYISSGTAEVYKWIDSGGQSHYSDVPPEGNKKAEIIEIKTQKVADDSRPKTIHEDNSKVDHAVEIKLKDYKEIKEHNANEDISGTIKKLKDMPTTDGADGEHKSPLNSDSPNTAPNKPDNNNSQNTNTNLENTENNTENNNTENAPENSMENPAITPVHDQDKQSYLNNKNCAIAKKNLENLNKNKIIINNHNNKLTKLSDFQHAKKIAETKKQITKYC